MKRLWAFLLAITLAMTSVVGVYADDSSDPSTPVTISKRIMSFNVLTTSKKPITATNEEGTKTRGEMLIEMFDTYAPDSIGLNEVTEDWESFLEGTLVTSSYSDGKEYALAGTQSDSELALKSGSGEYSPIVYRSDLYDLKAEGGWWFSDTPDSKTRFSRDGHTAMQFERVFSYAVLCNKGSEDVVYIHINAHYDHQCDDFINNLCANELKEKAEYLKGLYGDVPVVITGDQNADETTNAYAFFANGTNGYIDAKYTTDVFNPLSSNAGYGDEYRPALANGFTIDHIFVSLGNVGVVRHDIIENAYLSDHSAVVADIELTTLPNVSDITCAEASSIETNAGARSAYILTSEAEVNLNITANGTILYEGNAVDSTLTLPVSDGANDFNLIITNGTSRTNYTVTVYKESGSAFPVVSEIYPAGGEASFWEIANRGTASMALSSYQFFFKGTELTFDRDATIRAGETLLVVAGGTVDAINNQFSTAYTVANTVSSGALSSASDGKITVKQGETVISESSYAALNVSTIDTNTVFKFAVSNDAVSSGLFPYEKSEATPGVYESNLGITDKPAFEIIDGTLADKKSSIVQIESSNIGNTKTGGWVFFTNVDFGTQTGKAVKVNAAVKGSNAAGKIDFYLDGRYDGSIEGATHIATVRTTATAEATWDVYNDFYGNLASDVTGKHTLTLVFTPDAGKTYVANIANLTFLTETQAGASELEEDAVEEEGNTITVQCEWAVNPTVGYKNNGSTATPNLQNSTKVSTTYSYGGYNILGTTTNNATVTYRDINFGTYGIASLKFNLACRTSKCDGTIRIYEFDGGTRGDEIGYCVIDHTRGVADNYNNYQDFEGVIVKDTITGTHDILLVFEVTTGYDYVGNMDYFVFGKKLTSPFELMEGEDSEFSIKEGMTSQVTFESRPNGRNMSTHTNAGGQNCIAGCNAGSVVKFSGVNFESGHTIESVFFNVDVKNTNTGGHIYIYLEEENGTREQIGYAAIDSKTGLVNKAWDNFHLVEGVITNHDIEGVHDVVLEFDTTGSNSYTCKIDYMYFTTSAERDAFEKIEAETADSLSGSNVALMEIAYMNGKQFPTSTGCGLTLFKGSNEVCSVMWRYTDTYCTDANIKFGMPEANTTVLPIIDNSTDNEAVNFVTVHDDTAVADAKRLLELTDDAELFNNIILPARTAYGVNVSWASSNESVLTHEGVLLSGNNTRVVLTATFTRGSASTTRDYEFYCTSGKAAKLTYVAIVDENGNVKPTIEAGDKLGYVLFDKLGSLEGATLKITGYNNTTKLGERTITLGTETERIEINDSIEGANNYDLVMYRDGIRISNVIHPGQYLQGHKIKLFVIGDSITQFYKMPDYPRDGWGAELPNYLDAEKVIVSNHGKSGRSTNTFFVEKNFYDTLEEVRPGDYVLIQLATNDSSSTTAGIGVTVEHYKLLLGIMMDTIEEKGAFPVMVESACTHKHSNGVFADHPAIRTYNAAAEEVAISKAANYVSLYSTTENLIATEGFEGMKDIMSYCEKNDLRFIENPLYYTYTSKFGAELKTDSYHYSVYGSNLLAKSLLAQLKAKNLPISDGIDLSYEPVRLYIRTLSFNGTPVSRASYGASYEGAVTITYDLGAAPSGTVTIDGEAVTSGSEYNYNGEHVLVIDIDANNTNTIPFTITGGVDRPEPETHDDPGENVQPGQSNQPTQSNQPAQGGNASTGSTTSSANENTEVQGAETALTDGANKAIEGTKEPAKTPKLEPKKDEIKTTETKITETETDKEASQVKTEEETKTTDTTKDESKTEPSKITEPEKISEPDKTTEDVNEEIKLKDDVININVNDEKVPLFKKLFADKTGPLVVGAAAVVVAMLGGLYFGLKNHRIK